MSKPRFEDQQKAYVPSRPFTTAVAVGYSFVLVLTASLFLAVWLSHAALQGKPPQLPWQFFVVFSVGTWGCALLQLFLLYRFKDRRFWPQTRKQWLQRTGPAFAMMAVAMLPALMHVWNATVALAGVTMLLGVAVGIIPTLLCFADWLTHHIGRVEETIQLRKVDKSELPRSVRSYFQAHTDELNRMGFEHLGDYRTKQYSPTYARYFLNRERDTFAEICHSRIALIPLRAVCFFSLTPDGCYLESSNARLGKGRQTRLFELQILPYVITRDVCKQHEARLRELDQRFPRVLKIEDLEPVIHYGNKQLYKLMVAEGVVTKNPYDDFDESVLVRTAVPCGEMDAGIFETSIDPEMTASV